MGAIPFRYGSNLTLDAMETRLPYPKHGKIIALGLHLLWVVVQTMSVVGVLKKRSFLVEKDNDFHVKLSPLSTWNEVHCHKNTKYKSSVSVFSIGNLPP